VKALRWIGWGWRLYWARYESFEQQAVLAAGRGNKRDADRARLWAWLMVYGPIIALYAMALAFLPS